MTFTAIAICLLAAKETSSLPVFFQRACKETHSFLTVLSSKEVFACSLKLIPLQGLLLLQSKFFCIFCKLQSIDELLNFAIEYCI